MASRHLRGTPPADRTRAELTSVGLISTSLVAIELTGGQVSAHLHLLPILVFVALYQRWTPVLWTVRVVVVHHAVLGLAHPARVIRDGGHALHPDADHGRRSCRLRGARSGRGLLT
ncbi:MAG TPA: hypothetical protein VHN80_07365 [Kineosporiaceae bacterium]|jgi:hypothetical protein|nr:hypothetical protein [Kineosporiaceae bacterium]